MKPLRLRSWEGERDRLKPGDLSYVGTTSCTLAGGRGIMVRSLEPQRATQYEQKKGRSALGGRIPSSGVVILFYATISSSAWLPRLLLPGLLVTSLLSPKAAYAQAVSRLHVSVTSSIEHRSLPWAHVDIQPVLGLGSGTLARRQTDESGSVLVRGLVPGRYRLVVSAIGYHDNTTEVDVGNGHTTYAVVTLTPAPLQLGRITARGTNLDEGTTGAFVLRLGDEGPESRTLADVLERAPGVQVARTGGPGSPVQIRIRGSNSDQVLVLLDGVRLNSPMTGEADLSSINLDDLEEVIVLPGASAARFGAGALAGAVLLKTKTRAQPSASFQLLQGAFGERGLSGSGAWVSQQSPSPIWSASGTGSWTEADGDFAYTIPAVRGGGTARRTNASFDRGTFRLTTRRETDRWSGTFGVQGSRIRRGSPGTVVQPSLTGEQRQSRIGASFQAGGRFENRGEGRNETQSEGRNETQSDGRNDLGTAAWSWSSITAVDRTTARFADPSPPFGSAYDEEVGVTQASTQAESWFQRGALTIRLGASAAQRTVEATSVNGEIPQNFPEGGLWAQINTSRSLGQGTLRATAGLRLDGHRLVAGITPSPSLSVVLERGDTGFELGLRNTYSPPGLNDLFFQEGVLVQANPNLGPERIRGEITASVRHSRTFPSSTRHSRTLLGGVRTSGGVTAYKGDVDGMILWFPDHRFIWSPNNVDVHRRGVDTNLEVLSPSSRHSFRGNLSWSQVSYTGPVLTGPLAYRPSVSGSASLSTEVKALRLSGTLRYLGSRRTVAGSALNQLAPYTVIDVGMGQSFTTDHISGRMETSLQNVMDTRASFLVDYPIPGRAWGIRIFLEHQNNPPSR